MFPVEKRNSTVQYIAISTLLIKQLARTCSSNSGTFISSQRKIDSRRYICFKCLASYLHIPIMLGIHNVFLCRLICEINSKVLLYVVQYLQCSAVLSFDTHNFLHNTASFCHLTSFPPASPCNTKYDMYFGTWSFLNVEKN